jgi:hypothetical protein
VSGERATGGDRHVGLSCLLPIVSASSWLPSAPALVWMLLLSLLLHAVPKSALGLVSQLSQGGALAKLFDPLVRFLAPRYQAVVSQELRKYGMRYEDLYDPQLDLVSEERLPGHNAGLGGPGAEGLSCPKGT